MFGDNGPDHGQIEDNVFSVTRYGIESVCNLYGSMNGSAKDFFDEFSLIMQKIGGQEIGRSFWTFSGMRELLGAFLSNLKHESESAKGATKFLATLLLENEDLIMKSGLTKEWYDPNKVLIPLVYVHALLYRSDDLFKACCETTSPENQPKLRNYIQTAKKRLETFVRVMPNEEFLADLFAEALLIRKYGEHKVDFVNQAVPVFQEMLKIMKNSGLAAEFTHDFA